MLRLRKCIELVGVSPALCGGGVAAARFSTKKEAYSLEEGESSPAHCTIYTPARSASQQGMGNTIFAKGNSMWRIEFETEGKWENPLMGWTSTADPRENLGRMTLAFDSKESAMRFADSKGWEYTVREPQLSPRLRSKRFNGYAENFSSARAGNPKGGFISEAIGDKKSVFQK
ncbi:NADH dehydrogenase [Chloropicon primus]|uniref:NADH dehydrogenase [ubiquinone] iron-sulfur protein 4, mitochondrial n=1 Tax=Chloropicon primus TaxID=1764295 RepID=A0A5B8MMS7_9CHLO|nr:NADH dehydrogenase [ubiquinone] iron-sulfur protein 4 [Chloropicon primus]UPR00802.1 NADH dehydrogenase [Chloropicon primus]|mmetsp:Transcript_2148/g.5866  ORF Transcript_2148/g.5866 Transcript_2148/m.5866 type:complete len:173 (-) Transcript_2148:185-703(-)|eukprot:QDZ21591.1 NADH dehydrogenase [ubiquinone] iron-sulfur protein 4 [Chloropicon primus]